jgi:WD40 repeat protein
MTGITHQMAHAFLLAAADGLLNERHRRDLEQHLNTCDACRAYAADLDQVSITLKNSFHQRWDIHHGPSKDLIQNVHTGRRRIHMVNRTANIVKVFATVSALLILAIFSGYAIRRMMPVAAVTQTPTTFMQTIEAGPTATPIPTSTPFPAYHGLIAFVSEVSGQAEIYTMHPDGSDIKNLTGNLGKNYSTAWSPDGSRIAFVSERTGNADIFTMNADGSGVTQLTDNPGDDGFFAWSPDGQKIAYISSVGQDPNVAQLFVMNADGSGKSPLTEEPGSYYFLSWSPDSQQIVYENQPSTSADDTVIYAAKVDGTGRRELMPGVTGAIDSSIRWLDTSDFYAVVGFTPWQLYRLNITGMPPQLLASEDTPISAWFGVEPTLTYIVKRSDNWAWYRLQGTTPLFQNGWTFSTKCQRYTSDRILNDANITLSPDGNQGLVSVYCDEGLTWLYLVNVDGSNIKLLLDDPLPFWVEDDVWSPNGQYIFLTLGNIQTGHGDLYVIDLGKTLKDPSMPPVRLTNDDALKYDTICQPIP